jgi:hypothetical protein
MALDLLDPVDISTYILSPDKTALRTGNNAISALRSLFVAASEFCRNAWSLAPIWLSCNLHESPP